MVGTRQLYAGLSFTPDALKWVAGFYEAALALLHSEHKVGAPLTTKEV